MSSSVSLPACDHWKHADGVQLAYSQLSGAMPTVVFLSGYRSDMNGTKAEYLHQWCRDRGQAYLRFDYQGHGRSSGDFESGTIGTWANDASRLIDAVTTGPLVLVGSSMGGWLMLLVARTMLLRISALVGLAAAPDFTNGLIQRELTAEQRALLARDGKVLLPCTEGGEEPYPITQRFLSEGNQHLQLEAPIPLRCPVRLIHGQCDHEVPVATAERLLVCLEAEDVQLTVVKDGEHRLSRATDLALLGRVLAGLLEGTSKNLNGMGVWGKGPDQL